MSITVSWLKESQFKIITEKGFELSVDSENKYAPCPTEILLSALGSCSATDVVVDLQEQGVKLEQLSNEMSYTLTKQSPRLYKTVNLHFLVKGDGVTESQINSAIQKAIKKNCHVCLMLQPKIAISYSIEIIRG
jgi:putative redox protein